MTRRVVVTKILDQRTPTNLIKVRGSQLKKVEELFPKYRSEFAHKRSTKDKDFLVQDILSLGTTLAKNSPVDKLDELVYSIPEETDEVDTRNLSDPKVLENTIKELLKITKQQKHEIGLLKNDRDSLVDEVPYSKLELAWMIQTCSSVLKLTSL